MSRRSVVCVCMYVVCLCVCVCMCVWFGCLLMCMLLVFGLAVVYRKSDTRGPPPLPRVRRPSQPFSPAPLHRGGGSGGSGSDFGDCVISIYIVPQA